MKPTIDAAQVVEYYAHSKSVKATAKKFEISGCAARKILVSSGVVCTDRQNEILSHVDSGLSTAQIAEKLGITERAVKNFLPYTKGSYRTVPPSPNALRIRKHRKKKNTPEE